MALKLISSQILDMIEDLKKAVPYTKEELDKIPLDATSENCPLYSVERITSTQIKRILDGYFKEHPEEDTYGYLNGSCFK